MSHRKPVTPNEDPRRYLSPGAAEGRIATERRRERWRAEEELKRQRSPRVTAVRRDEDGNEEIVHEQPRSTPIPKGTRPPRGMSNRERSAAFTVAIAKVRIETHAATKWVQRSYARAIALGMVDQLERARALRELEATP